jgi:hypothetical protein
MPVLQRLDEDRLPIDRISRASHRPARRHPDRSLTLGEGHAETLRSNVPDHPDGARLALSEKRLPAACQESVLLPVRDHRHPDGRGKLIGPKDLRLLIRFEEGQDILGLGRPGRQEDGQKHPGSD